LALSEPTLPVHFGGTAALARHKLPPFLDFCDPACNLKGGMLGIVRLPIER